MDELMAMLTSKVGLSPDQAKAALGGIMGFMKDKLPPDVMSQITAIPGVGDFMNSLGDVAGAATDAAGAAAGAATGAAGAAAGAATDATDVAAGAATDVAAGAATDAAGAATDAAGGVMGSIKGLFGK